MNTRTSGRPEWTYSALYIFLCDIFPEHRTVLGRFDVEQLAEEMGRSMEAVYKWMRKNHEHPKKPCLSPENAAALLELANRQVRDEPLTIQDFQKFVFPQGD